MQTELLLANWLQERRFLAHSVIVQLGWHTILHLTVNSLNLLNTACKRKRKTNFILIRLPAPSSLFQSTYKITQGPRNNYLNSPLETNIAIIPCAVALPEEYFQRKLAHYGVYCICVFEFWRTSAFKTTVQLFFFLVFLAKLVIFMHLFLFFLKEFVGNLDILRSN